MITIRCDYIDEHFHQCRAELSGLASPQPAGPSKTKATETTATTAHNTPNSAPPSRRRHTGVNDMRALNHDELFTGPQHQRTSRRHNRFGPPLPTSSKICRRLRELREEAKLTQRQLADRLNTNPGRISDWELGVHTPSISLLARYAIALDTTVSDILDGVL